MYKIIRIGLLALLMVALLVSGCIDEKNAKVPTPSPPTTPSQTTKPSFEKLSPFEEKLVGKWSRYHRYDDSYQYYIFNSDRTGCYFEYYGSSRKKEDTYSFWELEPKGANSFRIGGLSGNSVYDYVEDTILYGGYKDLKMTRSSTSKDCS